jgi:hypothetical protein
MINQTRSFFLDLAAIVLFAFAALNLLAAFSSAISLNSPDPILPLSNRGILWWSGGAELLCSAYLLVGKNNGMKLLWLAWLTSYLAVYRAGLCHVGAANFGDCLGNFDEWFLIRPRTMAITSEVLIGFLLAGSYGLVTVEWIKSRKPSKMKSPSLVVQPSP